MGVLGTLGMVHRVVHLVEGLARQSRCDLSRVLDHARERGLLAWWLLDVDQRRWE